MKGPALFQGDINKKLRKYIDEILKYSSPGRLGQFQQNLAQNILRWSGFEFVQMKDPTLSQGEVKTLLQKYIDEFKKSSPPKPMGQFQLN